ncbi:uncharacterized protein LOC120355583 [Nilaparvata lugens]|uniref:uncharacterized protein LOC120355583 n=1 Tax=Nilaparvata lugens TaxID=108931 RepID=UPI00193EAEEE|nr:uncharacterized protein LOC120355583 [Nilaparvata lugens]
MLDQAAAFAQDEDATLMAVVDLVAVGLLWEWMRLSMNWPSPYKPPVCPWWISQCTTVTVGLAPEPRYPIVVDVVRLQQTLQTTNYHINHTSRLSIYYICRTEFRVLVYSYMLYSTHPIALKRHIGKEIITALQKHQALETLDP